MSEHNDFKEIDPCGGVTTFTIAADENNNRSFQIGFTHSRPTPAAILGIYALIPYGIPVLNFAMGGIGQPNRPERPENCVPVWLASDSEGKFGQYCDACEGYFRSGGHPAHHPMTCPYCARRAPGHSFLTEKQRAYIEHYTAMLVQAMEAEMRPNTVAKYEINMDELVDADKERPKPEFYYISEAQQTKFKCSHCEAFNDIRGRFAYCSNCGWRNSAQMTCEALDKLRQRVNGREVEPSDALRNAISTFDACCRDLSAQVATHIPMTTGRRESLKRELFHRMDSPAITTLKQCYEIDILRGIGGQLGFLKRSFGRRHLFEHNGGVVDEKYVSDTQDETVRVGQLVREDQANANRLIGLIQKMIENFDTDFHVLFPPTPEPIREQERRAAIVRGDDVAWNRMLSGMRSEVDGQRTAD